LKFVTPGEDDISYLFGLAGDISSSELAATALSSSVIMYLRDSLTSRIFQSGVDWESFSASSGMKYGKMLSFLAFLSFGWNTLLISTSLRA
jgi:hypothetical protein